MAAAEEYDTVSGEACQSGQAALAARLLKSLAAGASGGNLIFSPLSIHVAVAMMSAGAAGSTLAEILALAGAPSRPELEAFVRGVVMDRVLADQAPAGGPCVSFACGSWLDRSYSLKPAYRDTIVGTYKGDASTLDFKNNPVEARKEINAWVARATKNLITEVIKPESQSEDTRHVVGNAIYFKGEWLTPFDKSDTAEREFRRLDGSSVDVAFMQRPAGSYHHVACHDGFKVLRLPCKATSDTYNLKLRDSLPSFAMLVFLPDDRDGLPDLLNMITSSPEFIDDHLPPVSVPVGRFLVPKFKLTFCHYDIADVLHGLGLHLPFNMLRAEMRGIAVEDDGEDAAMFVSNVIHKAVVEVNEEGSEAAAYTEESDDDIGFSPYDDYYPPPPKLVDFVADHPFAFFIVEESLIHSIVKYLRMDDGEAARRHRAISGGLTAPAVRLADRLVAASADGNLVFSQRSPSPPPARPAAPSTRSSPCSVRRRATTWRHGARRQGPEFRGPRLVFVSGVWCDAARPFKPAYRAAVAAEYNAEATVVDFKNKSEEARKQINVWARQATGKLITPSYRWDPSTQPPPSCSAMPSTSRANEIESDTERKPFYRDDGAAAVADVPYMSSRSYQHVAVHDGFKPRLRDKRKRGGVDVGGEFTRYAMAIFLPDARDGLRGLVEKMASRPGFLHEHMPAREVPVGEFRVPKFKVSCGGSVVGALEQLGLRLPFYPELADLSDMDDGSGSPLFVAGVQHKAVMEVNEEGTVAAAATMTWMLPSGVPPPPVDFVADHPFAYFIVEMSSAVVFAGHVVDPSME
uniref:Serpin domain-containing protein n=1 Tax=Oryza punctata TaxID=4537 RepID=A0A0E0ME07_ORYPU